ncbi:protein-tyrosine-phosphatase/DNA-binding transcriptional ArsR family regulator [Streptomyces achromogenes]|uniref:Protein-tyrosine-phosphatase/DNA-binding transcriptional ArsR family regulator n=2 Tax=Streptomyces achromogenes TaxID=67255 RepID=A0ABU0QCV6_STRAH|nr:protein-tyrosine-phosphatase/DNA-binding transcriptional ArsR family regulator [Streptomyces achromogenes]MDQ0835680.1 protein-tyrosine-phosphatase/DNA-binding transcriptional ArsR family regulator [Streptomyces achromogenes]
MYFGFMRPSEAAAPAFLRLAAHPLRWKLLAELAASDYRVRELVQRVGQPQNLVSYHLRLLRGAGLVTARRSSFDARDSYYHLDLERCAHGLADAGGALHPALRLAPVPSPLPRSPTRTARRPAVLFACTGNSARSPIAEALLRHRTDGQVDVTSAGSHPRPGIHGDAVQVLREQHGVDISGQRPRHLETLLGRRFDYVISLCDKVREVCPEFGAGRSGLVHWSIPDPTATTGSGPAGHPAFVRTAAEIDTRIRYLVPLLVATPQEVKQ